MRILQERGDLREKGGDIRAFLDFVILRHALTMLDWAHKSITSFL